MNWYEINLVPRDLLFFKDAKPMEGGSIGQGAKFPLPNVFHEAMLTALKNQWDKKQDWEYSHSTKRKTNDKNFASSSMRFGGLRAIGTFPANEKDKKIYFPIPADIASDGSTLSQPCELYGKNNLPSPLQYSVASFCEPSKEEIGQWIEAGELMKYLRGQQFQLTKTTELYDIESRPGIAVEAETRATEKGKFYIAEYMRFRENISLKGFMSGISSKKDKNNETDFIEKFFNSKEKHIIYGGQQGVVCVVSKRISTPFEMESQNSQCEIKWLLLTPAVFTHGFLPGWIDKLNGKVLLQPKINGEKTAINAHLVATKIGKTIPFSGWKLNDNRPKATKLAVPAGSVYYFKANSEEDAKNLINALSKTHCRSDFYGEKGFGLGICGTWKLNNLKK